MKRQMRDRSWILRLKVGDVVRSGSGVLRVVRYVHHANVRGYGTRSAIGFKINRCSWTHRCYTILTCGDLLTLGYRPTGAHVDLWKPLDNLIEAEIRESYDKPKLTCCDVHEVPA